MQDISIFFFVIIFFEYVQANKQLHPQTHTHTYTHYELSRKSVIKSQTIILFYLLR